MRSKGWHRYALAGALVLGLLGWRTVAQEAARGKQAETNPSLVAADRQVIDATQAVTGGGKPASAAEAPAAAPDKGFLPPDLGNYQVTVFSDGLGLVRRVENIDLNSGRNEFEVRDVARGVDATSARLRPLDDPARFVVLEQSGGGPRQAEQLLAAAVGREVRVRDGSYSVSGKLLAVDADGVILAADDEVHVHPKGEVILPKAAGAPDLAPRLSFVLETDRAGATPAEVTYLTSGLRWSADYAVTVLPKSRLVSFDGWITLDNTAGVDLDGVGVVLANEPIGGAPAAAAAPATPGTPATKAPESTPGKRFYLPRRATLPNGTSRRFQLAQSTASRGALRYVATIGPDGLQGVRSAVRLVNNGAAGLGLPLPPGAVRVYVPDALGRLQLVGRQGLSVVDPDGTMTFDLGPGAPEGLSIAVDSATEDGVIKRTVRIRNQRAEDAAVTVIEKREPGWRLLAASTGFGPVAGGQASSDLTVPANGTVELRYQVGLPTVATTNARAGRGAAGGA